MEKADIGLIGLGVMGQMEGRSMEPYRSWKRRKCSR